MSEQDCLEPAPPTRPPWAQILALAAVRFYQVALRPLNPWGCKFHPSCSNYALAALERHGVQRGGRMALARLLRCRPGVFGGYDPVPELGPEANPLDLEIEQARG